MTLHDDLGIADVAIGDVAEFVRALDRLRRRAAGPARHRVGLDDLVRRTGIPRSSLHAYLSGEVLPPADRLDAIVLALGAGPAEARCWGDALDRLRDRALSRRPTAGQAPASGEDGPTVFPVFACVTWVDTPVYAEPSPSAPHTGRLYAGNSWVLGQRRGASNPRLAGAAPNDIWLYTQADDARHHRSGWGWIPAAAVRGVMAWCPLPGVPMA